MALEDLDMAKLLREIADALKATLGPLAPWSLLALGRRTERGSRGP